MADALADHGGADQDRDAPYGAPPHRRALTLARNLTLTLTRNLTLTLTRNLTLTLTLTRCTISPTSTRAATT